MKQVATRLAFALTLVAGAACLAGPAAAQDTDPPRLVAANPISVTSSAGDDDTYVLGDAIEVTATFNEAVTVTTVGEPVTEPFVWVSVGGTWDLKPAVYHSGSGTTKLVFRYVVAASDKDPDGISFISNALSLRGAKIADAAGNLATFTQLQSTAIGALARHKVDGKRKPDPPDAPTKVTVTSASLTSVRVGWTAPAGTLTDYDVRWFKGESDPEDEADWVEPGEVGGHDHVGTSTTTEIGGLEAGSAYRVQVRAKNEQGASGWSAAGQGSTLAPPAVSGVGLVSSPTVDADSDGVNETYKPGDVVRARVTFSAAVDVVGDPVLKLRLTGEKDMTFDAGRGRTDTRTLEFTYTVAAGNLARDGIAFDANSLSVGQGVSIRGTQAGILAGVDAELAFARVAPDPDHKVDGVPPRLIATNPVSVTSSAGDDDTYAIGDAIEVTATFDDAATVTTAGGTPRIPFALGAATKHAVYHSGSDTTELVFRYTVAEGDADTDGIEIAANALEFNGGAITDAASNAATLTHAGLAAQSAHTVDGVRPTVSSVSVDGATPTITFDEALDTTTAPATSAFTVSGTAAATSVTGVAFDSNDAKRVMLTLSPALGQDESGVTVTYSVPAANPLRDASGNKAAGFTETVATNAAPRFSSDAPARVSVAENNAAGAAVATVAASDPDGDTLTYTLDSASDAVFAIDGAGAITVTAAGALDHEATPSWSVTVSVSDGKAFDGSADPGVDATHRLTVAVTDVAEPPGSPPTAVTVTGTSASSVGVGWTAPADETGKPALTGYDVRWFRGSADPELASQWNRRSFSGTATDATLTGLIAGSAYRVQVRARNHEGAGPWSASGSGSTTSMVPLGCGASDSGTLDWIASVGSATRSITVTLNATVPGSDPTEEAGLHICRVGESEVTHVHTFEAPPSGSYTITHYGRDNKSGPRLQPGTDYWVRISADYGTKDSAWHHIRTKSGNVAPVFPSDVPGTLQVAENNAAGAPVGTVAATDPDPDTLFYALDSASDAVFDIDGAGAITVTAAGALDHEARRSWPVTVSVSDHRGPSGNPDFTADADHRLTVAVTDVDEPPDAPTAVTVRGTASSSSVRVGWTAPADETGKPALTDYDVRWFKGESDPEDKADWVEPGEVGGHDHVGTSTTTEIGGLDTGSAYRVQVRAKNHEGAGPWSDSGGGTPTGPPTVISLALVSAPAAGQNKAYKLGDVVRARVTFSAAVDVVGDPVLKLRLTNEKAMTFDADRGRTNTRTLEFTYTVAAGNLARDGIAFDANSLSVGQGESIRGTQAGMLAGVDAELAFARAAPDPDHKVDGVPPRLIATNPVSVTSSAGDDETYAIGDAIEVTATFDEAVTVTTAGGTPRIPFALGAATKHAVYHSGSDTTELVFRYTVAEGDADPDGIEIAANALALNGGAITDAASNAATLTHAGLAAQSAHTVDGVRPTVSSVSVDGATPTITFDEALDTTTAPATSAFTVSGTAAATSVTGVAFDSNDAKRVMLTLSPALGQDESGVTVTYSVPAANPLRDASGNKAAGFTETVATNAAPRFSSDAPARVSVAENNAAGAAVATVAASDPDGDTLTYALDSASDAVFDIDGAGAITVTAAGALDHEATPSWSVTVSVSDGRDTGGSPDPDTTPDATHRLTVAVTDVAEPPGSPPTAVTVTGTSASSVGVGWTAPADETGKPALTGYDVRWFRGSADPELASQWNRRSFSGTATDATLTGLIAGSAYRVQVRARNHEGAGPYSASGSGSTTSMVPLGCGPSDSGTLDWIASVGSATRSITVTLNATVPGSDPTEEAGLHICRVGESGVTHVHTFEAPPSGSYTITHYGRDNKSGPRLQPGTDYWVRISSDYGTKDSAWHHIRTKSGNVAPVFPSDVPGTLQVAENNAAGAPVGTVAATDPDPDTLTYTLDSASDAVFDIDGAGAITVTAAGALDHEATPSWSGHGVGERPLGAQGAQRQPGLHRGRGSPPDRRRDGCGRAAGRADGGDGEGHSVVEQREGGLDGAGGRDRQACAHRLRRALVQGRERP